MIKLFAKGCKGQALVELALIMPIILLLTFGIVEFARVFSAQLVMINAAREAARCAAVGGSDTETISKAQNSATVFDIAKMLITIYPAEILRTGGDSVTVTIEYPVTIYAPVISSVLGNPYIVRGEATMRVE